MQRRKPAGIAGRRVPLEGLDHSPALATSAQAAIFFAEQMGAIGGAYNYSTHLDVHGPASDVDLRQGCMRLITSTPALRLRFTIDDLSGNVVYQFSDDTPDVVDLGWLRDDEQLKAAVEQASVLPFELDAGALCRFQLFRISDIRAGIIVTVNHLIADGISHARLIKRLAECVDGPVSADAVTQYEQLVERVRLSEELARNTQRDYWQLRLVSELQHIRGLPTLLGSQAGRTNLWILGGDATRLRVLSDRVNVSLFKLLIASVHTALPLDDGVSVLCAATSQRLITGPESTTIGDFVNEVPLLARHKSSDNSKLSILAREADNWHQDLRHRNYPYVDLANDVAKAPVPAPRLDAVMVGYRRTHRSISWSRGVNTYTADLNFSYTHAKTELSVRFFDYPDRLECEIQWSESLAAVTAKTFVERLSEAVLDD